MKVHGNPQETLLGHATDALRRALAVEASLGQRQDHRPSPGDLFVFEATREHELEWLVLLRGEDSRWLVVPADTVPLVGSADVEVPPHSPGGPLSLRCRWGVWLEARDFVSAHRVGVVSQEDLDRAQRKWREIEEGRIQATVTEQDVDGDPEYGEWERVLRSARKALHQRRDLGVNDASCSSGNQIAMANRSSTTIGRVTTFESSPRHKARSGTEERKATNSCAAARRGSRATSSLAKVPSIPLAIAASALFVLTLGIVSTWTLYHPRKATLPPHVGGISGLENPQPEPLQPSDQTAIQWGSATAAPFLGEAVQSPKAQSEVKPGPPQEGPLEVWLEEPQTHLTEIPPTEPILLRPQHLEQTPTLPRKITGRMPSPSLPRYHVEHLPDSALQIAFATRHLAPTLAMRATRSTGLEEKGKEKLQAGGQGFSKIAILQPMKITRSSNQSHFLLTGQRLVLLEISTATFLEEGDRWIVKDVQTGTTIREAIGDSNRCLPFEKTSLPSGKYEVQLLRDDRVVESRTFSIEWE